MSPVHAVSRLAGFPLLRRAQEVLRAANGETLDLQATIAQIPAPSGAEAPRAAFVARHLRALNLGPVLLDGAGNVVARAGDTNGPAVVIAAHLDTVFGADVDHAVRRNGVRLAGPGISDNARGLAGLLALARTVSAGAWRTERPLVFAATVGEEGDGNLRGARHLFGPAGVVTHAAIVLDGAGLDRVVHRALGARRFRVSYRGPGGHSWAAYGVPNPAHAVGRFAAGVAELARPPVAGQACSVVRLNGGTGVNSIPSTAWAEVDIRGEQAGRIDALEEALRALAGEALQAENQRRARGTVPLQLAVEITGNRPTGTTPPADPLVRAAMDATRAVGREPELTIASTDANVPISLGIPAVALGAGGAAGHTHLETEWYDDGGGTDGLYRALLVLAAAAGLEDREAP